MNFDENVAWPLFERSGIVLSDAEKDFIHDARENNKDSWFMTVTSLYTGRLIARHTKTLSVVTFALFLATVGLIVATLM